jgi:tRNA(Ile)-lysidine synthase TilS/MesJ
MYKINFSYKIQRDGDLRIIRPFIYVREKELRAFAEGNRLPIIPENCPGCFEAPKERQRMKQLLAQQEVNFPCLFGSLLAALHPIISIDQCRVSIKSLSAYGLKMIKQDPKLYDELVKTCKADSGFEKSAEGDFI